MRGIILLLACFLLGACAGNRPLVVREPVEVIRYVYVRVDPSLTRHGTIPAPRNDTGEESLRVNRERKKALQQCFGNLDAISEIEGTPVPKGQVP